MPKRNRTTSEKDTEEEKCSTKRVDTQIDDHDEEEDKEEDYDEEEDDDDVEADGLGNCFVAWLEEGATCVSVGELHFSNQEHVLTYAEEDENQDADGNANANAKETLYCVVCQLHLMPPAEDEEDDEAPLVYSFEGSGAFPFRVLPAEACVGIELEPVQLPALEAKGGGENDQTNDSVATTFSLAENLHQALLEDLRGSDSNYEEVPSEWRLPLPKDASAAIDGVNAWWKAGEAKTGWDLSRIPEADYATTETLACNGTEDDNVLLALYRDLCAFRPLTEKDDRDTIEERFELRTCLCTYFAWAVPTENALQCLVELGVPLLEIGAGTGYWAWLLSKRGVDIAAYDLPDSQGGQKHRFRHSIVKDGSIEQASSPEHKSRALLLCWPDIVGDSAHDDADRGDFGAKALRAFGGSTVVHVGELGPGVVRAAEGWGDPFPPGGSSSSAALQDELRAGFRLSKRVLLPNWPPYNSHLTVWVRK